MKLPILLSVLGAAGLATALGSSAAAGGEGGRVQTAYYANGRVQSETALQDGEKDGPFRRWYPDGTPMAEGAYREGLAEGAWCWWRPDGTLDPDRSGRYERGVRVAGPGS